VIKLLQRTSSKTAIAAALLAAASLTLSACDSGQSDFEELAKHSEAMQAPPAPTLDKYGDPEGPATVQQAREFLEEAEAKIVELNEYGSRVYWVNANFITDDTNWLAAKVGAEAALLSTNLANRAKRYNDLTLPTDMARKMDGLKRGSNFPAPDKAGAAEKLSTLMTKLDSTYGTGKFVFNAKAKTFQPMAEGQELTKDERVLTLGEASDIIAHRRSLALRL